MDSKEKVQAANALVHWFNSQEIGMADATVIMAKVLAKVLIQSPQDTANMRKIFDGFVVMLADEANNRAFNVIHGKRK